MKDTVLHRSNYSLSADGVDDLFRRWRDDRDRVARDRLVEQFLPLAYKLARRYHGAWEPVGDLRQVAALGLIKAIDGYDPDRGNAFSSYAVPSILGELRRYFRDCGWALHVPRGIQELALKVQKVRRSLETQHAVVTVAMIAEYLELSVEEVAEAMTANAGHHTQSLDVPLDDDEDTTTVVAKIGGEDPAFARSEVAIDLARAGEVLSEREREVVEMRFREDLTQAQIGEILGVSQMQISRTLRRALGKLGDVLDPDDLEV